MYRYLLALLVLCSALKAQVSYWSAYLDGAHESPAVVTSAHGWAIVRHDAQTNAVRVFCYATGTSTPSNGAQLHQGAAGINGPILLNLVASGPNEWTGNGVLTAAQANALAAQGLYLNVHTVAFPAGEIRGQVTRSQNTRLTAVLSGTQVAPPATTVASGLATAFLFEPENRLAYAIEVAGILSITAAHVHVGSVGANGPILDVPLGVNGSWCGVTNRLSDNDVAALRAGQCYADVHSSQFPNGEIRGQLRTDLGSHFVATCTGAEETPPTASQAVCTAQLVVTPDNRVELTGGYSGLVPISAHVHTSPPGVAGPILFNLTAQNGVLSGTFNASSTELGNLRAGLWYVNVHSNAFTNG
ncbi:MAG: CHRD domain-containing protein, partial [Planctomycetota bacterium]